MVLMEVGGIGGDDCTTLLKKNSINHGIISQRWKGISLEWDILSVSWPLWTFWWAVPVNSSLLILYMRGAPLAVSFPDGSMEEMELVLVLLAYNSWYLRFGFCLDLKASFLIEDITFSSTVVSSFYWVRYFKINGHLFVPYPYYLY